MQLGEHTRAPRFDSVEAPSRCDIVRAGNRLRYLFATVRGTGAVNQHPHPHNAQEKALERPSQGHGGQPAIPWRPSAGPSDAKGHMDSFEGYSSPSRYATLNPSISEIILMIMDSTVSRHRHHRARFGSTGNSTHCTLRRLTQARKIIGPYRRLRRGSKCAWRIYSG